MKILQVNKLYSPWIGGVETVAQDIAEYFNAKEGVSVTNLVCQPKGARISDEVNCVPIHRAASWGTVSGMPLSLDFFGLFRDCIADADVVILHHPFPLAFIAYALFGRGKRVLVWYHSDIIRQRITRIPFMPFIRFVLSKAQHILVSNHSLMRNSKVLVPFQKKCRVVPFGIDVNRFYETEMMKKEAEAIRERYGTPLILSVGRLVYYKGFSYLIEAMKSVPARLLIIGKGPLHGSLMRQIDQNGLADKVKIISIDNAADLAPWYHACDIFALPSCEPSEVFGIVQLEAMACGKPVVNTSLPTGVPEVSVAGRTGHTVPPKSAHAFAAALNEILADKQKYGEFARNGVAEVAARFTKGRFSAEMENYLC